jgi:very-short-patch-repair endonuclease
MAADPRLTRFARSNRKDPTKSEAMIWADLRMRQLGYRFRRQQPIGPCIVDFVCFSKKLVVELDGWTHGLEQNYEHDEARQQWLEDQGFVVLRFTDDEVMADRDGFGDAIFALLDGLPTIL